MHFPGGALSLANRVAIRSLASGSGVFALEPLACEQTILTFQGVVSPRPTRFSLQIGPLEHLEPAFDSDDPSGFESSSWRFLNHSCAPNARVQFPQLIAASPIGVGEEITFNYNTTEYELIEPFRCQCGAIHCAEWIRGFKFVEPEDRARLLPLLPPYLVRLGDLPEPRN